jgi:glucose/arabinose dehydrogenase
MNLAKSERCAPGRRDYQRQLFRGKFALSLGIAWAGLLASDGEAGVVGRQRVASGLHRPLFATFAPGDDTRLYIAERGNPDNVSDSTAAIRILDLTTGDLQETPYLTIPNVNTFGEGGLLGLTFHPDFQNNHKLYVSLTQDGSDPELPYHEQIREYTAPNASSTTANSTYNPIISWNKPDINHNAGWIGFGPNDGYLYIMAGDGGHSDDWGPGHNPDTGNAQDVTANLMGKVLRLDVDRDDFAGDNARNYGIPYDNSNGRGSPGNPFAPNAPGEEDHEGDDEIWAYGLRNPFRASFDRATGDLWIGDVGQQAREELNFQPGNSTGGENYGWRMREGSIQNPNIPTPAPAGVVDPIYDVQRPGTAGVDQNLTGAAIFGGVTYRGPDPELQGYHFFGDTVMNRLWMLKPATETTPQQVVNLTPLVPANEGWPAGPAAISEDSAGNLYISYFYTGEIYRIVTDALTPGDFNADAKVDSADLEVWKTGVGMATGAAAADGDADGDGDVDGADFLAWQRNFGWSALNVGGVSATANVPEPASAALVVCGMLGIRALARRES